MRRWVVAMLVGVLTAASAHGGTYYEAKTSADGGRGAEYQSATVKAWVDGDNAKVEFVQTRNPLLAEGGYLLSRDGGATVYFVNPKEKTYAIFDPAAMAQMMGGISKMIDLKVSNLSVEKLEESIGQPLLGMPTKYYKYRTTYTTATKILGMRGETRTEQIQQIWAAPGLIGAAFGVWLKKEPPATGDPEFDKLVRAEVGKVEGVPLKMITTTTTTEAKKGRTETTTITMEVTNLQVIPVAASTFELPRDYREVSLVPGAGEGEDNPLSKVFGGKKKG